VYLTILSSSPSQTMATFILLLQCLVVKCPTKTLGLKERPWIKVVKSFLCGKAVMHPGRNQECGILNHFRHRVALDCMTSVPRRLKFVF
jgi:hypothetical protein